MVRRKSRAAGRWVGREWDVGFVREEEASLDITLSESISVTCL